MKRKIRAGLLGLAILGGGATASAVVPDVVEAAPSNCRARVYSGVVGNAVCTTGTGQYRVRTVCATRNGQSIRVIYGPWRRPIDGISSTASCDWSPQFPRALQASTQIR